MTEFVEIPQPSRFRISELFRDNNFIVPLYQRNYAWGTNEVEDFWGDLLELVKGYRNSHFFGQIVTYKNEQGDQEIIDGQQRLTTSTLFMAAIRDTANRMYRENFSNSQASEAELESGDLLRDVRREVDKSIRGKDHPSLIVQQNADHDQPGQSLQDYFFDLTNQVAKAASEKLTSEPKRNMQRAYKEMTHWIVAEINQEKTLAGRIDRLQLIFESFFNKFYIVMISAPSRQDAFTIFETLNSRGKDLRASDIIKNHVMSLMGTEIKPANDQWNRLTNQLDNDSDKITRFIRTYWAAKKRIVPESKLYRAISTEIKDVNTSQQFLDDLDKVVALYTVLESPTSPKAHDQYFKDHKITETLEILARLHVKLYYPVVIAMVYKKYSEASLLKVVTKLLAIFIRHRTIINDGTNKLETGFSDVAHRIWNLDLKSVDEIIEDLNEKLLPKKDQTEASFQVLQKAGGQRGAKKWTLVYLLAELYSVEYDDFGEQLFRQVFKDDDYQLVQVDTTNAVGDDAEYLGNWTLLEKRLVKTEVQAAADLVPALQQSGLTGNQRLAQQIQNNGWSAADVRNRQDRFTADVTLIW
ncbi:DUF262 domain-containing protein [Levilactobacillus namurensis]|uniref:DUF262 domain-containing protein n=1 Tax=Levilactobacillus namurensis TaxID=380393 RepID=UPI0028B74530|nr:DUF262 domain-containing protein [Levilactobacillus namurensis]MDT7019372.1 DUF262 domain-containing protein [Levilactobacillus namurensis]WNN66031.1 DUF262 domain-containing protein [Levilactobacillus namurensis]